MNGTEEDIDKGHRLGVLIQTPEWREFLTLCAKEYDALLLRITDAEDAEARGGIKTINSIMQSIYSNIKFGEDVRRKVFEDASRRKTGL